MDIFSVAGFVVGFVGVILGMVLDGGNLMALIQIPAALVVFGGTLGAVLVGTPKPVLARAISMLKWVFIPPEDDSAGLIEKIVAWLKETRGGGGLRALERAARNETDPMLIEGLQMVADGYPAQKIRPILETMAETEEQRDVNAVQVFASAGGYSPTVGIIGAILGLITVLSHLNDPSKLGEGIATAFVATIYGVGSANLVYFPISTKLRGIIGHRARRSEMVIEGLSGISSGLNSIEMEVRLRGFLDAPAEKPSPDEESENVGEIPAADPEEEEAARTAVEAG